MKRRRLGHGLFVARRISFMSTLLVSTLAGGAIISGHLRVFVVPESAVQAMQLGSSFVGTLVQSVAGAMGIAIAVLFVTAQIGSQPRRARTLRELYRSGELATTLGFFLTTLVIGVAALIRMDALIIARDTRLIDLTVVFALASFLLIVPLVLLQLENMDPVLLGTKLVRRVTPRSIGAFGLVVIEAEGHPPFEPRYWLQRHGMGHGSRDPLGPMHELVMQAVGEDDRVLLSHLTRLLADRSAALLKVRLFPLERISLNTPPDRTPIGSARDYPNLLATTLHILHYMVRRAANLTREWADRDVARHPFILDIEDLAGSISDRKSSEQLIQLCLFAILHISLAYADVKPHGAEPLRRLPLLAHLLNSRGKTSEAQLTGTLGAVIMTRTRQLATDRAPDFQQQLPGPAQLAFDDATAQLKESPRWLPAAEPADPWRYFD